MTEAATPRVFISHGSEDKDRFVLGFATQLLERGIDAWIDQWEIVLGDSLVQRIFSIGIAGADAFIVILSSTSVNKSWVQAELDAAVVRNIEDNTRLIVIRLDDVEVPTALREEVDNDPRPRFLRRRGAGGHQRDLRQLHEAPHSACHRATRLCR